MAKNNEKSNAATKFQVVDRTDWLERLARAEKSDTLLPVLDNVVSILRNDEHWQGVLGYDEMGGRVMKLKAPPFERGEVGEWMDIDDARLEHWFATHYQLRRLSSDTLSKGVLLVADDNRYHEVREYLEALQWDGTPRAELWLFGYLGAEPSDYVKAVGAKWLVGAVARAMRPGCKVDNVLILEGAQGLGKSTALKILFHPWFTDAAFEIGSTDGYQIMRGMWGVELAELDSFGRAESSRSKAFFTRSEDRYRNPYGRKPVTIQRTCVFAGSVNHATYLKDDSGNRRYWPVKVAEGKGVMDLDALRKDRDQIWAEAFHLFKEGFEWWVRASDQALYEAEQDARYIGDAYETRIERWLDKTGDKPGTELKDPVNVTTLEEIMRDALGMEPAKMTLAEQQRVGRIMARFGWQRERSPTASDGSRRREWFYCRPGKTLREWREWRA